MQKLLAVSCAAIVSLSLAAPFALAEEAQTLKERLSDKASDAQRVDDCHVPPERRGTEPRPDCSVKPQASTPVETHSSSPRQPR
jgi:hypothetical protein